MGRYLTNVALSDEVRERVENAAINSGMNIEYRSHPMPNEAYDYEGYNASKLIGFMGSIFSHERGDHSKFWDEYALTKV